MYVYVYIYIYVTYIFFIPLSAQGHESHSLAALLVAAWRTLGGSQDPAERLAEQTLPESSLRLP